MASMGSRKRNSLSNSEPRSRKQSPGDQPGLFPLRSGAGVESCRTDSALSEGARMIRSITRLFLSLFLIAAPALRAQEPAPRWIGTWAASPMGEPVNPGQPSPANTTYRNIVHISAGGASLRVQLTNEFGARPLTIGSAHVALSAGSGSIQPATDHALTFSGQASVIIPPGALMVSDPVSLQVAPLTSLAVSIFLPDQP